jgi:hypothetical protein
VSRRKVSPLDAARALAATAAQIIPVAAVDDDPPPKKPPRFCPWCGGQVKKCWTPHKIRSVYQRPNARVAHVCLACKVAVRAFKFPEEPLFESRKAARADAQRDFDELEASGFIFDHDREKYRQGKCSCRRFDYPIYMGMPPKSSPCPIHAPLPGKTRRTT